MGDRIIEEAHANRSFAHKPLTPLPVPLMEDVEASDQVDSESVQLAQSWESVSDETAPDAILDESETEAEPIPATVWMLIAIVGTVLVALSAYLGITRAR